MASLWDAVNDSIDENHFILKHIIYALPIFFCASLYIKNNVGLFYFFAFPIIFIMLGVMSCGIANVRQNKREILTLNPIKLLYTVFSLTVAIVPLSAVMYFVGYCITAFVKLPFDLPYLPVVFKSIVWILVGSIVLTSFLSYSKSSSLKNAYNFPVIFESCVDVFINILFLIPQLLILNGIIIGAVWYLFFYFKLPLTNPFFVFYCSLVFVFNISVLSDYFAQISYELIKGEDEEYKDNYYIKGTGSAFSSRKK